MMSWHLKHTCKTWLLHFHKTKHACLALGTITYGFVIYFFFFATLPVNSVQLSDQPSLITHKQTFLTGKRLDGMKPLHIIASYDQHLQKQQDLSDFYCFVLIVDLKDSSLAIINFRQTVDILTACYTTTMNSCLL